MLLCWLQGEADTILTMTARYHCMLEALILDWREKWYEGTLHGTDPNMPFGIVQVRFVTHPEGPLIECHHRLSSLTALVRPSHITGPPLKQHGSTSQTTGSTSQITRPGLTQRVQL